MQRFFTLGLLLFIAAISVQAQQPDQAKSTATAKTRDALAPVRSWSGQWQCRGISYATEQNPTRNYNYRMRVAPAMLGSWLRFVVPIIPEGKSAPTIEGQDFWGQDPATGQLIEVYLDSTGGYGSGRIERLTAKHVRYKGETNSDPDERFYDVTFDIESSGRLHIQYQGSKDGKSWRLRTEDHCKKVSTRR
jgi:hypothetical protein